MESYTQAIGLVLAGLGKALDRRKCVWCNYPTLKSRLALQEKAERQIARALTEWGLEDRPSRQWLVGVPHFRVIVKGTPHLAVEIDLYLVASWENGSDWWPLQPKADSFEFPLALLDTLPQALAKGELEAGEAQVVEREDGSTTYCFLGQEWRVPDAFVGFLWALAEKKTGFEGLVDPATLGVLEKAKKALPVQGVVLAALPQPAPGSPAGDGDVQDVVLALTGLGYKKGEAEKAALAVSSAPGVPLEEKIKMALQHLGKQ